MNFIVAVSENYAIGKDNDMLFNLPSDLKYFKETTLNKVVVMGRKTYYSLPKRPLKNRTNIVLSSNENFKEEGVIIVHSFEELFEELKKYNTDDVFIIGGATLYNKLMDYCKLGYITKVEKVFCADTFITNIEELENWKEISSSEQHSENGLNFKFKVFENLNERNL